MRIITQPTVEPITLAEVKAQLGIPMGDTGSDTVIVRRITEARQWAEDYMQRAIVKQTQEIRLNAFPHDGNVYCNAIKLPYPNLLSVVSVKYIDLNGVEQTIASTDYVVDTYEYGGFVRPAYGLAWPYPRIEANAVRIQYTCGYDVSAIAGAKTITAATNATPGVFTSAGHGFSDGNMVQLTTTGMTVPNLQTYLVYAKATDTFQLANLSNNAGLSSVSWGTFVSGTVQQVEFTAPSVIKEGLLLLIGHWMNFQPNSENGTSITRVPYAVRDLFDKYSIVSYA